MTLIPFFFLLVLNVFIVAKQSTIEPISASRKTRYFTLFWKQFKFMLSLNTGETGQNNYKAIEPKKEHAVELARKASSSSSATDDTITMVRRTYRWIFISFIFRLWLSSYVSLKYRNFPRSQSYFLKTFLTSVFLSFSSLLQHACTGCKPNRNIWKVVIRIAKRKIRLEAAINTKSSVRNPSSC